ncbi:uncharacterized protein zgc:113184 [Trichomycterus rosablanca]|uniref:uncharacterized protein zgc:113184 n=1 Tax=Trichomycterus rosablanca TaxID=2290929 RepID=UPI002F35E871
MEDAYTALYQEFLRLQFLCLKQAAMLQHLTEALRRQQGVAPVPNGELHDLVSKPFQCGPEGLGTLLHPELGTQVAQTHAPPPHLTGSGAFGTSPVVGGMKRLQLDPAQDESEQIGPVEAAAAESPGQNRTEESSILEELRQAEQHWHGNQPQTMPHSRRPWSSSFLNSEMLSEAGGMLMSRITLQSQVCEFCHAVFPGHTTTRGEFLRHLNTHIS